MKPAATITGTPAGTPAGMPAATPAAMIEGRTPARLGECAPRPALHAWEQLSKWWVALLAVAGVATAFAFAVGGDLSPGRRAAGLALLAILGLAYRWLGYPAMRDRDDRRSLGFIVLAISLEAGLLALHPSAFSLLFGLYPQCYSAFRRTRSGLISALVLTAVVGVASFGWAGWRVAALPSVLMQTGFSAAFGVFFAVWITRIIRESTQRAAVIAELERARGELEEAHRLAGMRAERERLAGEIHDTLAQGFTSIVLLAQAARSDPARRDEFLQSIEATARDNLAEARALVNDLGPAGLVNTALVGAIQRVADQFASDTGVAVELHTRGEARALPADCDVALLRAAQESFANVRKHAAASRVTVELVYGPEVRLSVSDDGRGFDPATAQGFGLAGLRRRVAQAGGTAQVISAPGQGSRIDVELP